MTFKKSDPTTFDERFWRKVDKSGGPDACWPWTGHLMWAGYGVTCMAPSTNERAHRAAWRLTHGPIASPRILVCHKCDNPPCCNPAHLFLGTAADNTRDMVSKGRHNHGASHYMAKATPEVVRAIKRMRSRGATYRAIGEAVGLSAPVVCTIALGKAWKSVVPDEEDEHRDFVSDGAGP